MESSIQDAKPSRIAERRNMFLAASLCMGESSTQCRIRNMTEFGALVECDSTMPVGTTVILARGELSVAGEVRWSRSTHFGMKFSDFIEIQKWLDEATTIPSFTLRKPVTREAPYAQRTSIKDETILDDKTINRRISEELLYISRIVEEIGGILVKDPVLRVRHAASLQLLDMGQQMLSEISQIMTIDNKIDCISQVATGSMRGRLQRAKPI